MRPTVDDLKRLPILKALPVEDLSAIAERSFIESRPKGTVILEQEDKPNYFFHLMEGTVECSARIFDTDRCVKFINEGEFFPLNAVVLDDLTVSAYVALSECRLLRMPATIIRDHLRSHPAFAFAALQESALYCRDLICEKQGAQIRNGADRLAAWLLAEAHRRGSTGGFDVTLPKGKLAELLGFAPEMLSRYLTVLKEAGVSSTHTSIRVECIKRLEGFLAPHRLLDKWMAEERPIPFGKLRAVARA